MTLQKPDTDQAAEGSLPGMLKEALSKWLRNEVDDMLPAIVVSYDRIKNRAVIQPLVMVGTTDGAKISRASIPNIPVFQFGGGGFFIRFPLLPGDFGWIKASDRDISLVMQSGGGEDWPNTKRLHSFSDAMFFPDVVKDWAIAGENDEAVVIQSLDGTVYVALRDGEIEMKNGDSSIKMTATAVHIVSDELTHNGINIGYQHTHSGSATAPNGPVSPTGFPQT